jgi:hypothetical protein
MRVDFGQSGIAGLIDIGYETRVGGLKGERHRGKESLVQAPTRQTAS